MINFLLSDRKLLNTAYIWKKYDDDDKYGTRQNKKIFTKNEMKVQM